VSPAKGRPATPASQAPKRPTSVPDVPTAPPDTSAPSDTSAPDEALPAPAPPAATNDGTQLLGPSGEPLTEDAPTGETGEHSAPPAETGDVHPEERASTPSPGRSRALFPGRVWPD
jgi:hypothetical protein